MLVNNAGFSTVGDVHANPRGQIGMVRVNVEALLALTTAFLPGMVERGRGAVINVASVAAFQPVPVQAVYAATKAFVLSFTEGLLGAEGHRRDRDRSLPRAGGDRLRRHGRFKKGVDDMPSYVSWSTAEDVAKAGIEAAEKGNRVVIPGITNRVTAMVGQHSPRSLVLGPMARIYRRAIGE